MQLLRARGAIYWPVRVPAARPAPRQPRQSHCGRCVPLPAWGWQPGAGPGALCSRQGDAKLGSSEDPGRSCGVQSCVLGVGGVWGRLRWRSSEGHDLGGVTVKTKGGSSVAAACWCLRSLRLPLWPTQGTDSSPAVTSHISWFKVSVPDSVNGLSGWGECSGETAGLFGRLALEVWGTFRDLKLLCFLSAEVGKFFLMLESVGVKAYKAWGRP